MLKTDIKDLFSLCITSKRLNIFCQSIISEKLSKETELDTSNYTLKQLRILYENKIFGTKRIIIKYDGTLFVKDNGDVYIMGLYGEGSNSPRVIEDLKNVIKADNAGYFEVFLTKDGKVYVSGEVENLTDNTDEEANLVPNINNAVDISADEEKLLVLLSDGTVTILTTDQEDEITIPNVKDIISVYQNGNISYFLTKNGKIYKIDGYFDMEEIPINNVKTFQEINGCLTITQINNGKLNVLYYDRKYNKFNNYDIGNLNIIDIEPLENAALLLDNNGDVYLIGETSTKQYELLTENSKSTTPIKINGLKNIIYMSVSYNDSFFVDVNKNVYVLGLNSNGELGTGDLEKRLKPTLNPNIII